MGLIVDKPNLGRYRLSSTRKTSRVETNRDLLTMLMVSSDSLINSFRKVPLKNVRMLPLEITAFLAESPFSSRPTPYFSDLPDERYNVPEGREYSGSDSDSK
ncbi:hypothetical protein ILUMI_13319 [Ignelater luminosus]|uniref:Uncharacterized protein n=1 Tax=Ignelater luminosus TaxID=2038154 RepID=A0A8K0CSH8_IGNLU|nr:hypothetical protein ILUMI_13319 [Ignelater luminosus]